MSQTKGKLLIASPKLLDSNFVRTVLLMVDHSSTGALGLILNKPSHLPVRDLWAQVSQTPCPVDDYVFKGGPCTGTLMVLHSEESYSQISVLPGVHFSSELKQITPLLNSGAWPLKVFYGYAGWGDGQLESELESGSWLLAEPGLDQIFGDHESLWDDLIQSHYQAKGLGNINPRFIPPDPSMN